MNDADQWEAAANPRSGKRVGVVDVGSNSVRLVVFEALSRSPAYFFNEKVLCGLGADLQRTGALSPDGRRRALAAIRRFTAQRAERIGPARAEHPASADPHQLQRRPRISRPDRG
jgi:hypothetical protein